MVYSKEKWIAALKKAIADTKHEDRPTTGLPCAIASVRYVRDGLLDDIGNAVDDQAIRETVKDCCNELIKQLSKEGSKDGFASNARSEERRVGKECRTRWRWE